MCCCSHLPKSVKMSTLRTSSVLAIVLKTARISSMIEGIVVMLLL